MPNWRVRNVNWLELRCRVTEGGNFAFLLFLNFDFLRRMMNVLGSVDRMLVDGNLVDLLVDEVRHVHLVWNFVRLQHFDLFDHGHFDDFDVSNFLGVMMVMGVVRNLCLDVCPGGIRKSTLSARDVTRRQLTCVLRIESTPSCTSTRLQRPEPDGKRKGEEKFLRVTHDIHQAPLVNRKLTLTPKIIFLLRLWLLLLRCEQFVSYLNCDH